LVATENSTIVFTQVHVTLARQVIGFINKKSVNVTELGLFECETVNVRNFDNVKKMNDEQENETEMQQVSR